MQRWIWPCQLRNRNMLKCLNLCIYMCNWLNHMLILFISKKDVLANHDAARSRFCGRSCPDLAARCFHGRSLPPMFASPRRSSCARMFTNIRPWRFGNFVWILGKKHCALNFENKQRFGTCPNSFFGGKKCKTSSLWFRIQWVQISGVLHIRIRG